MTGRQDQGRLYQTGFLIGPLRRRAAIRALERSSAPEDIRTLAVALCDGHPDARKIARILRRLSPDDDAERIEALWTLLQQQPTAALAAVLLQLGWPPDRVADTRTVQAALSAAGPGADPAVLAAVALFVRALPIDNAVFNEAIFAAWLRSQSAELGRVIAEQRRPPSLEVVGHLADALCTDHRNGEQIAGILRQLSAARDSDKVEALWVRFTQQPAAALAAVLLQLGWPPDRVADTRTVQAALSAAGPAPGPADWTTQAAYGP